MADYLSLTDMTLRTRREPDEQLFIAEGEKVIQRAVDAGFALRSVLCSPKWIDQYAPIATAAGVTQYVASNGVLEQLTGFHVHRGALAAFSRKPVPPVDEVIGAARRVLICEDVNNHTNLGAIFRSAAGLGIDAVLLSTSCSDPLYRRSVRVSMGSVLSLPYARFEQWPGDLRLLRQRGFTVAALTLDDAEDIAAFAPDATERVALVLGTEGTGMTDAALKHCDRRLRIPMSGGIDSLNVAAAAAVACFAIGTRTASP